jgi:1,5-anhydro-D-fructose reductase (1,5-anhydro-D-mannitol-forming)
MMRIAMLSFAHVHAAGYAKQVQDHPETSIACVWDDNEERGRAAAESLGVPYESDLDAVLSRDDIDGVVVNATTKQHTEVLLAACRYRKHIFTEKALTVTSADADRVVAAVRESGIKFMISLPSRIAPENLYMKELIESGKLGKITLMRARIAHSASLDNWFKGGSAWFGDADAAGGGALFDLGCHTVDVMRWFLGEPVSVISKVQNFSGAYDIDDNSAVIVEFKSGALGILDTSWVQKVGPNPVEIYGTQGYVARGTPIYNGIVLNSTNTDVSGYILPTNLPKPLPMPYNQWVDACLHGKEMSITVEDGRNLTQLLEATYISASSGKEFRF